MLHIKNINVNRLSALAILGFLTSSGISLASSTPTHATDCTNGSISCIAVQFGNPVGDRTVDPSSNVYSATQFYLPVSININHATGYTVDYAVKVYGSGSSLSDTSGSSNTIPSVLQNTSYNDLGKNGSEWGIRWHFGDKIEDAYTDYRPVPTSSDDATAVVISDGKMDKATSSLTKQLTLGFAVAVDGNQASGSYSNTITVAVVASPKDARTLFDISTMQEMTPEICSSVSTPNRAATDKFDTTGEHMTDPSYIPEVTLTDTRDNKTYLVRKLADGNCWMSQNLSLNLVAGKELNQRTTDLNSKRSWVPSETTQTTTGEAWGQNDGTSHSISYNWEQYWNGGIGNPGFSDTGNPVRGGTVGYAQRGNYYNWFAATAGSGEPSDTDTTTEAGIIPGTIRIINGTLQDSICPRGWTLPVGGKTATNSTDGSVKSFYNLLQIYTGNTGNISNATVDTLYSSPMNFVPTGYYFYRSGIFGNIGELQTYMSGTASATEDRIWNMHFASATVFPGTSNYGSYKGNSYPIRCVSR